MPSSTVEDYIKQIYLEQQHALEKPVSLGRLAAAMGVVPGTVTTMMKALADAGLVSYEPRGGVQLTDGGQRLALHVLRRHRLVELFLVKMLGLDWSEVHAEAEELEHAISEKVLVRMDALLDHPRVDPHGDPIPTAKGHVAADRYRSLADSPAHVTLRVARIIDQDPGFLQFVDRCGLVPGTTVTIQARDRLADAVTVQSPDRKPLTLGTSAACKILVEDA